MSSPDELNAALASFNTKTKTRTIHIVVLVSTIHPRMQQNPNLWTDD